MTSSGIEQETFRLVAQHLNQTANLLALQKRQISCSRRRPVILNSMVENTLQMSRVRNFLIEVMWHLFNTAHLEITDVNAYPRIVT